MKQIVFCAAFAVASSLPLVDGASALTTEERLQKVERKTDFYPSSV